TPKGVMVEHSSVVNLLQYLSNAYPFSSSDAYLLKTSYTFDVSVTELFGWYPGGGRLAVLEIGAEKDPGQIINALETHCVSHINFVPSMFSVFLEFLDRETISRLSFLKYIFLAGEALPPVTVERFNSLESSISLENLYGPTEATVYASRYSLSQWPGTGTIPIGTPIQNTRLYILDSYRHVQPVGITGELCISGTAVTRGYLNRPELTMERFVIFSALSEVTLYKTGDLARWLGNGNIEFLGRIDRQVKIRGYRIEPGEIQRQLTNHEDIDEAVVVAREDSEGEKELCAYIVPVQGDIIPAEGDAGQTGNDRFRDYLRERLPDYMIPAYFMELESFPRTPAGKVALNRLPGPLEEQEPGKTFTAPRDHVEHQLKDIWTEVLDRQDHHPPIGIDDHFFRLGGHSLKANSMLMKVNQRLNVKIPLAGVFKSPTIKKLAQYIRETPDSGFSSLHPVKEKEFHAMSPAQERLYVLQQMDLESLAYNMPVIMEMTGTPDPEKLEEVFKQLIRRHESLRTSFKMIEGETVQCIHDQVDFNIKTIPAASDGANYVRHAPDYVRHGAE
ncbi:MAG: AMP-binding protein, partial [bacterium]|nr:AMP-binding protein [bacterium]